MVELNQVVHSLTLAEKGAERISPTWASNFFRSYFGFSTHRLSRQLLTVNFFRNYLGISNLSLSARSSFGQMRTFFALTLESATFCAVTVDYFAFFALASSA